jgi:predicted enzyme related to lactoylglutathione lyase
MKIKRAFSSFSTDDLDKTQSFYARALGLDARLNQTMGLATIKLGGGGEVMIYPKPDHKPAVFTVFNLVVDDIDEAVYELGKKGVEFERYEDFDQDQKGIARSSEKNPGPDIAWLKDPAGNIIALMAD